MKQVQFLSSDERVDRIARLEVQRHLWVVVRDRMERDASRHCYGWRGRAAAANLLTAKIESADAELLKLYNEFA